MNGLEKTWQDVLITVRPKISESNFNKWIKRLKYLGATEDSITLAAPDSFVKGWVQDYYEDLLSQELYSATQKNYILNIEVNKEAIEPGSHNKEDLSPLEIAEPTQINLINNKSTLKLNPKYGFEKFVVGSSNQFAHAASIAAADLPGGHYNPLFIYGGVGLGKTHLLNAAGLKILEKFPQLRILYMSAEQFMNELIFCIRFEKMDQFRKKYRENCDVLLVDDIQFMIGKERTQEEFFHTFNTLYESQRQIIVTSDRLPGELNGLEERLRSRFEWGLIADIQPPDLETRIAILKKKADLNKIFIADDVALFLASQIKSNIRELEGSLIRLSAFMSLEKRTEITVDFAKDVLKNIVRERASGCSIETIQRTVADFYHIKVVDLKSPRRLKSISTPRQVAMYLCKEHLKVSYPEIGQKFGGKDHSTVIHAVKKISALLEKNDLLKKDVELIEKVILD